MSSARIEFRQLHCFSRRDVFCVLITELGAQNALDGGILYGPASLSPSGSFHSTIGYSVDEEGHFRCSIPNEEL